MTPTASAASPLSAQVAERDWYHTIDLAPGITTPGWFDCRRVAKAVLPESCAGLRCLDIGTFDGFWAFNMEARGADEVIAIDILDEERWDWPAMDTAASRAAIAARKGQGGGFTIASEALNSSVERQDCSVYELSPESQGEFDLIYLGSLLLHLRDPVKALEAVRRVCRGKLVAVDAISLPLSLIRAPVANLDGLERPYWWKPNLRAFSRMVESAGFRIVEPARPFLMPPGRGMERVPLRPASLRTRAGREQILTCRVGDPHARLAAVRRSKEAT
jgi:tRNA (mo5U34)-methyltransferase